LELLPDGSFTYVPREKFNREDFFAYRATDGVDASPPVEVTIVIATAHPWHNGLWPLNVNDDELVTPIDALLIINALNRGEAGRLLFERTRPLSGPFYDVNRDGFLSPADVLQVINYLNRDRGTGLAGEAEAGGEAAESPSAAGVLTDIPTTSASRRPGSRGRPAAEARNRVKTPANDWRPALDVLFAKWDRVAPGLTGRMSTNSAPGEDDGDILDISVWSCLRDWAFPKWPGHARRVGH
jgi:hypothetical protein